MSLYLIVFVLMMLVSIKVRKNDSTIILTGMKRYNLDGFSSMLFAILLFVMLLFCYGRSPDYYQYKIYYTVAPDTLDFNSIYYTAAVHTEFLWKLLCHLFKLAGISFELFVGIVTSISFWYLHKFLDNTCKDNKIFAHLWVYASFYLVYFYIGIRNGLVISVYLSLVLPWLFERKYVKYFLGVLVLAGFHSVSIVFFAVPLIKVVSTKTLERVACITGAVFGLLYIVGVYRVVLNMLPTFVSSHIFQGEQSGLMQLLYRVIFIVITLISYRYLDYKEDKEPYYKVFLLGTIMYFITVGLPVISVRIFDLFNILEVVIISSFVKNGRIHKRIVWMAALVLVVFMYWYHIESGLNRYTGFKYNVFNFPYINIFEKKDILESWYIP